MNICFLDSLLKKREQLIKFSIDLHAELDRQGPITEPALKQSDNTRNKYIDKLKINIKYGKS
jgi:hypothetical protein